MRPPISVWQGCSDYWQPAFIRENLLPLGHAAWQGYLTQGRGMVVCEVEVVDTTTLDWIGDVVKYDACYIPVAEVSDYFKSQDLKADFIDRLMETVRTYCPEQQILLATCGNGQITVDLLQHLAVSPPDCYQQVLNRWDEFALEPRLGGRCDDVE